MRSSADSSGQSSALRADEVAPERRAPKRRVRETASGVIARAIAECRLPLPELARRTGTKVTTLSRFMKGQSSLTLATFELLAAELKLQVATARRRKPGKRSSRF